MSIYKVEDIIDADYGCEECPPDGPHAQLVLDAEKRIEVSEKWISDKGIQKGKYIWVSEDNSVRKAIRVVAAIIKADVDVDGGMNIEKIFATQRGYGDFKDGWEFPGGKIEEGETPEDAIVREIKEELDTIVKIERYLDTIEYDYPEFHLSMDCFLCSIVSGTLVLKEHEAARWLSREELDSVEWLPADITIIDEIRDLMR